MHSHAIYTQTERKPLATAKEVCAYLRINDVTLWRWYSQSDFPKPTYPGRDRRFDWDEIYAWEDKQKHPKQLSLDLESQAENTQPKIED